MKRILTAAAALAILFVLLDVTSVGAKPPATMLSKVDINTAGAAVTYSWTGPAPSGTCWSFDPEQPGNWGGEFGGGAVTAFPSPPSDGDDEGYCTLYSGGAKARHIQLRVLDGIADDSFNVYVENPGGNWTLVYAYTADASANEVWVVHDIYSFPAGKGQGSVVDIKIEPTNVGWSGFTIWGQLAVDYVKLFDH